jgi:hypothetical protein
MNGIEHVAYNWMRHYKNPTIDMIPEISKSALFDKVIFSRIGKSNKPVSSFI